MPFGLGAMPFGLGAILFGLRATPFGTAYEYDYISCEINNKDVICKKYTSLFDNYRWNQLFRYALGFVLNFSLNIR